jgi:hypothetical protein
MLGRHPYMPDVTLSDRLRVIAQLPALAHLKHARLKNDGKSLEEISGMGLSVLSLSRTILDGSESYAIGVRTVDLCPGAIVGDTRALFL